MTTPLDKALQTSSSSRIPTVAIFITAASWAGFAIWLGVNPGALLSAFGIETSTPQMLTEVRAFYGGVEMAIALAMVVLFKRDELFGALLVGGLPLVGSPFGRRHQAINLRVFGGLVPQTPIVISVSSLRFSNGFDHSRLQFTLNRNTCENDTSR